MGQVSENALQQSVKLAQQAAAQMQRAASLAENAAQLWQRALALTSQEELAQTQAAVPMPTAGSKRPGKQHFRPEMTRLIESARQVERQAPSDGVTEGATSAPPEHVWEEGDNWWKPRQQTEAAEV
jgi:hypothetical protein